jgi:hypothetical protein
MAKNLIDTTYFIADIFVPLSNNETLNENFEASIVRYESEVLKDLVGYTLFKALKAQIDAETFAAPWDAFVNGAEFSFEFNGSTINEKWNGLVNTELKSLIAYYVYYWHRKYNETTYSGIGENAAIGENSKKASSLDKMVWANSNMVNLYGNVPKYVSFQDSGNYVHYDAEPSAYNYLLANIDDFDGWVFKPKGKVNAFGI